MPAFPLLTYAINTTPSVLTAGLTDAAITVLATNLSTDAITIAGIEIGILTGTSDADLTNNPAQMVSEPPHGWPPPHVKVETGKYVFVFIPSGAGPSATFTIQPGSTVHFVLSNIVLNTVPGTTMLTVTEGSTGFPTQSMDISIWPAGWGTVSFKALPANLPDGGGDVVMSWNGPQGATYQLQYIDQGTQQIINIPVPGDAPLANNGVYPGIGKPVLFIDATTVFTLAVSETILGTAYYTQLQATVNVVEVPSISSFTGVVTYNNGIPSLELNWETSNANYVTLSGTDNPDNELVPNTSSPYPISLPFASSYSITAHGVGGMSVQSSTIRIGWGVSQTIPLSSSPVAIAVTPNSTYALINSNEFDLSNETQTSVIQVMTLNNFTVIDTISSAGNEPLAMTVTPNSQYALYANNGGASVGVLSLSNLAITQTIGVGGEPQAVAVAPDGSCAMVANSSGNTVSVIALGTPGNFAVTHAIPVGNIPYAIAFSPNGVYAFVTNFGANTVSVIMVSSLTVIHSIAVGSTPQAVAVTMDGNHVLVVNSGTATVSVIRISDFTITHTVPVGNGAQAIALTPDGHFALVVNSNDYTISVIAINDFTVWQTLGVAGGPWAIAITNNSAYALTAGFFNNTVSVLSLTVIP